MSQPVHYHLISFHLSSQDSLLFPVQLNISHILFVLMYFGYSYHVRFQQLVNTVLLNNRWKFVFIDAVEITSYFVFLFFLGGGGYCTGGHLKDFSTCVVTEVTQLYYYVIKNIMLSTCDKNVNAIFM